MVVVSPKKLSQVASLNTGYDFGEEFLNLQKSYCFHTENQTILVTAVLTEGLKQSSEKRVLTC